MSPFKESETLCNDKSPCCQMVQHGDLSYTTGQTRQ
jgi:hypothetical protein